MPEDQLPLATPEPIVSPPPDDSGSLADHEATYASRQDRSDREVATPPVETPQDATPETPEGAEEEERDPKTGRFVPRKRHTAAKDQAGVEDAPRIRSLSDQLRAAREELAAVRAQSQPTPAPPAPTPAPVSAPSKPKPTADAYTDWSEFQEALTDWKVEQALTAYQAKQQQTEHERARAAEQQRIASSWAERVTAAKTKYPDFESVALLSDTRIPQGSLIDAWILEHKAGADILYQLQKDPTELDRLLNLPLFDQAEALALLSQRMNGNGSSRSATVATGSAPAPPSPSAPRPPNPVRTGPQKSGDEPPDETHSSLYDHEKYYWQRNGAHR